MVLTKFETQQKTKHLPVSIVRWLVVALFDFEYW